MSDTINVNIICPVSSKCILNSVYMNQISLHIKSAFSQCEKALFIKRDLVDPSLLGTLFFPSLIIIGHRLSFIKSVRI